MSNCNIFSNLAFFPRSQKNEKMFIRHFCNSTLFPITSCLYACRTDFIQTLGRFEVSRQSRRLGSNMLSEHVRAQVRVYNAPAPDQTEMPVCPAGGS